ncbi:hypothetical protein CUU62_00835 [Pseudomonas sp. WP001]|nr:hypothetical protein CUU62_00835 [Pseudomonas sp. WP001]
MIVPTLCVGMPPWTLRVLLYLRKVTRSVTGCIPTRSVGTINQRPPFDTRKELSWIHSTGPLPTRQDRGGDRPARFKR